jgi:hypothetical protein
MGFYIDQEGFAKSATIGIHMQLQEELRIRTYFAHPYCSTFLLKTCLFT